MVKQKKNYYQSTKKRNLLLRDKVNTHKTLNKEVSDEAKRL